MSTTKIEAVLKAHMRDAHARRDREAVREAHEAMRELVALRNAAREFAKWAAGTSANDAGPTAAIALMEQIAKEKP